jgi:hypothetical protein
VLSCLLAVVWTVAVSVEAQGQDHAGDKQALEALYNATGGENWANNENWLSRWRELGEQRQLVER